MRKINFFLLCCFGALTASGQGNFYFGQYFFEYDTLPCPFNSNETVIFPKGGSFFDNFILQYTAPQACTCFRWKVKREN